MISSQLATSTKPINGLLRFEGTMSDRTSALAPERVTRVGGHGANTTALLSCFLAAGYFRVFADLLRALGLSEAATWLVFEEALAAEGASVIFQYLYEPEGME